MPARSGFESFTGLMISARATPAVRAEAKTKLTIAIRFIEHFLLVESRSTEKR
jgi:hypothetical protein